MIPQGPLFHKTKLIIAAKTKVIYRDLKAVSEKLKQLKN